MPDFKAKNTGLSGLPKLADMAGTHLFHFGLSNCSQRVRLALEEKGVVWESHIIDLSRFQQLDQAYLKINSAGLVPTLVHDGQTITESNEIIRYIDRSFDGPVLTPADDLQGKEVEYWLDSCDDVQAAVKMLTYEIIFRPMGQASSAMLSAYEKRQPNKDAVAFMRNFVGGFSSEAISKSIISLKELTALMNERLSENSYLIGNEFSLADISAVVNIHRIKLLRLMNFNFPAVDRWFDQMQQRPSFAAAIMAYSPKR